MTRIFAESEYQTLILPDVLSDGTQVYVAFHPEIRGLRAHGSTPEEALASLKEGFKILCEDSEEDEIDLPEPAVQQLTVVWRSVSHSTLSPIPPNEIMHSPTASFMGVRDDEKPLAYTSGSR